jgi:hypothetical protein
VSDLFGGLAGLFIGLPGYGLVQLLRLRVQRFGGRHEKPEALIERHFWFWHGYSLL